MDYKNILIATDGSKIMDEVYEHAIYVAKLLDAKTHIVNVIDVSSFAAVPIDGTWDRIFKIMLFEGDKITQDAKRLFATRGINESKVGVTVLQGRPSDEINKYADTHNVDLIIIGTPVRTGLDRLLIGSVADKVIRMSKVPVLVVRGEKC
ncbi:MAG: universal stress protein [Halobacteriota archaeon]